MTMEQSMFINFDPDHGTQCDNCGMLGTVMHLLVMRSDNNLNLCAECFRAIALAFGHAARKLKLDRPLSAWPEGSATKGA